MHNSKCYRYQLKYFSKISMFFNCWITFALLKLRAKAHSHNLVNPRGQQFDPRSFYPHSLIDQDEHKNSSIPLISGDTTWSVSPPLPSRHTLMTCSFIPPHTLIYLFWIVVNGENAFLGPAGVFTASSSRG